MFHVGQKVCLWQEEIETGKVTVLKEVIVTVEEIKTGVLGEFSEKPSTLQSLRGIGDDGQEYQKHWRYWPESQTQDFNDRWSMRDDGEGEFSFWVPKEAVHAYNDLSRFNREHGHGITRLDKAGNPILPKGDVDHCVEHDFYSHKDTRCWYCYVASRKTQTVVTEIVDGLADIATAIDLIT